MLSEEAKAILPEAVRLGRLRGGENIPDVWSPTYVIDGVEEIVESDPDSNLKTCWPTAPKTEQYVAGLMGFM